MSKPRAIIAVQGGVVEVVSVPTDIELEIREYDNAEECIECIEGTCPEIKLDQDGNRYHEIIH
jgi:hypothetical protein